jgi:hypothetical protein
MSVCKTLLLLLLLLLLLHYRVIATNTTTTTTTSNKILVLAFWDFHRLCVYMLPIFEEECSLHFSAN